MPVCISGNALYIAMHAAKEVNFRIYIGYSNASATKHVAISKLCGILIRHSLLLFLKRTEEHCVNIQYVYVRISILN